MRVLADSLEPPPALDELRGQNPYRGFLPPLALVTLYLRVCCGWVDPYGTAYPALGRVLIVGPKTTQLRSTPDASAFHPMWRAALLLQYGAGWDLRPQARRHGIEPLFRFHDFCTAPRARTWNREWLLTAPHALGMAPLGSLTREAECLERERMRDALLGGRWLHPLTLGPRLEKALGVWPTPDNAPPGFSWGQHGPPLAVHLGALAFIDPRLHDALDKMPPQSRIQFVNNALRGTGWQVQRRPSANKRARRRMPSRRRDVEGSLAGTWRLS